MNPIFESCRRPEGQAELIIEWVLGAWKLREG